MLTELSPKQRSSIQQATARLNIWHGSVRSGKTVASEVRFLQHLRQGPSGEHVMVGKTQRTLKRNILVPLQRMLGARRCSWREGVGEARILGKNVYLVGANDERAEQKIRGGTFSGAYGDEVTLWPESFFQMLLSRLSVKGAALFGTTNADGPLHWLKTKYLDRAEHLHLKEFTFRLSDNPFLDPEYVAALTREYTGLWKKRFIEGLWVLAEGVIWDAFDVATHVAPCVPANVVLGPWWGAIDYGTSNPFVALLFAEGSDGRIWVLDEWRWDSKIRGRQLTDAQYTTEVFAWMREKGYAVGAWYVDPSAASFKLEAQKLFHNVQDADNDVNNGLRRVATLIANDGLRVLSCCGPTILEVGAYSWDARAQLKGEDAPLKINDHGPDTIRYGVYSKFNTQHAGLFAALKAQREERDRVAREKENGHAEVA